MSDSQLRDAALIIVDFQEDFCPPNGSLAIPGGRDIAGPINKLMQLPWGLKVATRDWHPQSHISFASNHDGKKPFDKIDVANPSNAEESQSITLWPDHCVQNAKGAELVPELDVKQIDHVVKKGQNAEVEMFSAFKDAFERPCVCTSDLASVLRAKSIERAYVVGLARDFCVNATARHAAQEGFQTTIIAEGTRGTDDSANTIDQFRKDLEKASVQYQTMEEAQLK